jgi:hypothetical protein
VKPITRPEIVMFTIPALRQRVHCAAIRANVGTSAYTADRFKRIGEPGLPRTGEAA